MGKLKTHKGLKKALNVRQSGSITVGHPGGRHNTGKKNAKFNRKKRKPAELNSSMAKKLKNEINLIK